MTGTILKRELLVPSRKARTYIVRAIYSLLLTGIFGIIYLVYFFQVLASAHLNSTLQALSLLAQWFVNSLVSVNLFACLVFTPAYMASAIAQEKDKRTIQDLLLTTMGSTEIVLSKFLGRTAQVALVLLAGMPMFAVARLLGGADDAMLLALMAMTLLWLVTSGSFTMFMSVLVRRTRDAVIATYSLGLLFIVAISLRHLLLPNWLIAMTDPLDAFNPLYVLQPAWSGGSPGELVRRIAEATVVLGCFSALMLAGAIRLLRPLGVKQLEVRSARAWLRRTTSARSPDDRPMLWKEKYFPPSGRIARLLRRLGLVAVVAMLGLLGWLYYRVWTRGLGPIDAMQWLQATEILTWPVYISLLLTTSSAFSGEREQNTWDAILATPLDAKEIVVGKLWGTLWEVRWWLLALALATVQALSIGMMAPATQTITMWGTGAWPQLVAVGAVVGSTAEFAGGVLFLVGLGLRISLSCQTSGKALAITLAIWIGSGIALGIILMLVFAIGAILVLLWTEWFELGAPTWIAGVVPMAIHLTWIGPLLSGLFWGAVGIGLAWSTVRVFDELAVRMRTMNIESLEPTGEPPGEDRSGLASFGAANQPSQPVGSDHSAPRARESGVTSDRGTT